MCYYSSNLDLARANAIAQKDGKPWPYLEPVYCKDTLCASKHEQYIEWIKTIQSLVVKQNSPSYLQ